MPAILSDGATYKHRIAIVQSLALVRVIDETSQLIGSVVDKLVIPPVFEIANWRVYADDDSLGNATPLAAQNTPITVGPSGTVGFNERFRVRFQINEQNTSNPPLQDYLLRVRWQQDQFTFATLNLRNIISSNDAIVYGNSPHFTHGDTITNPVLVSPGGSFVQGRGYDNQNLETNYNADFPQNGFTEIEVCVRVLDAANGGAADHGDSFQIGVQLPDGTDLFSETIANVSIPTTTGFPNEPNGFTVRTERAFSAIDEDGWSTGNVAALSIQTDANAPASPSSVGRVTFSGGSAGGTAPIHTSKIFTAAESVYVAFPFKVSANWQGHQSGIGKILFVKGQESSLLNSPVIIVRGVNGSDLHMEIWTQSGNFPNRVLTTNLTSQQVVRDEWRTIEILLVMNSGDGVADGETHVWVNGTKIMAYTDVEHGHSAQALSWRSIHWNPVWGGVGDEIEETMFQYIDHIYLSTP